ncbi:MAG: hypothetical protein ABL986_13035 [Vicinamibacterales bacterium]
MKRITSAAAVLVVALLAFWSLPAQAQDLNPLEKTYLTFSNSVELPGMTLPAGEYTFRLADTPGRNVVQVLSRDEKMVHGQFLFMQSRRPDATSDTVVMFRETAEGATPAVQYWYYPGERIGKEFIYPKDQALKIAARTHAPVLAADGDRVATIDDRGNATPLEPRTQPAAESVQARAAVAPAQAPAPVLQAPVQQPNPVSQTTPAPVPAPRQEAIAETLPQTASSWPLIGFAGLLALAAAMGLRTLRA